MKCSINALVFVGVYALLVNVCGGVPAFTGQCNECEVLSEVCGTGNTCIDNGTPPNCDHSCVCLYTDTGGICQESAKLPNQAVIRERVEVKLNPLQGLNILEPGLFNDIAPEQTTTTTTTTTSAITTTTTKKATTTTPAETTTIPPASQTGQADPESAEVVDGARGSSGPATSAPSSGTANTDKTASTQGGQASSSSSQQATASDGAAAGNSTSGASLGSSQPSDSKQMPSLSDALASASFDQAAAQSGAELLSKMQKLYSGAQLALPSADGTSTQQSGPDTSGGGGSSKSSSSSSSSTSHPNGGSGTSAASPQ